MSTTYEDFKVIEIPIKVTVRSFTFDRGDIGYDWIASNGDDSDQWFETAEEAEEDARSRYE